MLTPTLHPATPVVSRATRDKRFCYQSGLAYYAHSETGRRGGINQDAVLVRPSYFFGVADGVGGGAYGEVASQTVLEYCAGIKATNAQDIIEGVKESDRVVAGTIARLSELPGASTLAAVWLNRGRAFVVHIGDARVYLLRRPWRGGYCLERMTEDQTYANIGLDPPEGGNVDDPCRMLGTGLAGEPRPREVKLKSNDVLLLCSDGLHRFVTDHAIERIVIRGLRVRQPLQTICRRLARQAVENNGMDDISIVVLRKINPFPDRLLAFVIGFALGSSGAWLFLNWLIVVAGARRILEIAAGLW